MRVNRDFAPHLIHELLRCYASLRFAPVGAEQTSTGCLAPRNSTHIRNPLIFQGKSLLPHVCAGQQVRALILQAGTSSDLLTLVSLNCTILGKFVNNAYHKVCKYSSTVIMLRCRGERPDSTSSVAASFSRSRPDTPSVR